jgi:hypothetical protein
MGTQCVAQPEAEKWARNSVDRLSSSKLQANQYSPHALQELIPELQSPDDPTRIKYLLCDLIQTADLEKANLETLKVFCEAVLSACKKSIEDTFYQEAQRRCNDAHTEPDDDDAHTELPQGDADTDEVHTELDDDDAHPELPLASFEKDDRPYHAQQGEAQVGRPAKGDTVQMLFTDDCWWVGKIMDDAGDEKKNEMYTVEFEDGDKQRTNVTGDPDVKWSGGRSVKSSADGGRGRGDGGSGSTRKSEMCRMAGGSPVNDAGASSA